MMISFFSFYPGMYIWLLIHLIYEYDWLHDLEK